MTVTDYNTSLINPNCGIYEIVNKTNGHRYIGSSVNIHNRTNLHIRNLNQNKHHSRHLQSAWNKYKADAFEFGMLISCPKNLLLYYEQQFLDLIHPEYNISPTASSVLGTKRTEEQRKRMSKSARNKTAEQREHIKEGAKNRPPVSDETRRKQSIAKLGKPSNCSNYSPSQETRNKISATLKSKHSHTSEAQKEAARRAATGNQYAKGYKHTEEEIHKISDASNRMWEKRRMSQGETQNEII